MARGFCRLYKHLPGHYPKGAANPAGPKQAMWIKLPGALCRGEPSLQGGGLSYIITSEGIDPLMNNSPVLLTGAALFLGVAFLVPGPAVAAPYGGLAPHKAIYTIKMTAKSSGSPILNISGEMYFELKSGCEAWTTDHRFNLNYEYADSPPMKITSDFTTYEPYAGGALDFNSRRMRNGELFEETRGRAESTPGKGGTAVYSLPEDLRYKLPPGTLHPMAHTAKLVEQAKTGKTFYTATVFDGSDDQGPAEISTFLGKPESAPAALSKIKEIDQALLKSPGHNMRMAFFPLSSGEGGAEYEMSALFHENGIISDMTVEYKEFTIHQTLTALQALEPESCGAAPAGGGGKTAPETKKSGNTEKGVAPAP